MQLNMENLDTLDGIEARNHDTQPAKVVFRSEHLEALFIEGSSDYLLITLNEAGEPANGRTIWGQSLVTAANITTLGLMTRTANWFPREDMHQAIAALAPLLARYKERISFGHSMGGYGVIKYSKLIGTRIALSFCPQYSISPGDVGAFDDRYIQNYRPHLHDDMRITADDVAGKIYVFSDPFHAIDRTNLNLIRASAPSVTPVPMAHTGHGTIVAFRGRVPATTLFELCRRANESDLRAFAAQRRRTHPQRLEFITENTITRHPPWAANTFFRTAATLPRDLSVSFAIRIANAAMDRRDPSLCHSVMTRSAALFPDAGNLFDSFSHLLARSGDLPGAIDMARRVIALTPDSTRALLHLAGLLSRAGDQDSARAVALSAEANDPNSLPTLQMLAHLDRDRGDTAASTAWLERAVPLAPQDAGLRAWLATAQFQAGALNQARQHAEQALSLDPTSIASARLLGDIALRDNRPADAVEAFRAAVALTPDDANLRSDLTYALMLAGDPAAAKTEGEEALKLNPANIGMLSTMVEVSHRLHDHTGSAAWARAVVAAAGTDAHKMEWAAWMLLRAGDQDGALSVALSALGLDPSNVGALRCLAELALRAGKLDHATIWVSRAAEADPGNARLHLQVAQVLLRRNHLPQALKAALAAQAIQPDLPEAQSIIAEIDQRLSSASA